MCIKRQAVKLNGPLVAGGNVGQYVISDDSAWVIYLADQVVDEVYELFSVPVAGDVYKRQVLGCVCKLLTMPVRLRSPRAEAMGLLNSGP